jgi:hypothetical protein
VIRVEADTGDNDRTDVKEICGTEIAKVHPILSKNNTIRISFLTSPDKVNGLQGFNFSWTEVRMVQGELSAINQCLVLQTKKTALEMIFTGAHTPNSASARVFVATAILIVVFMTTPMRLIVSRLQCLLGMQP